MTFDTIFLLLQYLVLMCAENQLTSMETQSLQEVTQFRTIWH